MGVDPRVRDKDVERGEIVRMLVGFHGMEMLFRTLRLGLDDIGVSLTIEDIEFHLQYLERGGYVELVRRRETPAWRAEEPPKRGESADDIIRVQLTNKGLWLYDKKIPADP